MFIVQAIDVHVLDTGPLLCLGMSQKLRNWYYHSLQAKGRVVGAVREELRRHARSSAGLCVPAKKVLDCYGESLLSDGSIADISNIDQQLLNEIRSSLHRDSVKRASKYGSSHVPGNEGEAYSIYVILKCLSGSEYFVSNDNGALREASRRHVERCTFVDLYRYVCMIDRSINRNEVFNALQICSKAGVDIGEYVTNVIDLKFTQFGRNC